MFCAMGHRDKPEDDTIFVFWAPATIRLAVRLKPPIHPLGFSLS